MKIKFLPAILCLLQPVIWWAIGAALTKYDSSVDHVAITIAVMFTCLGSIIFLGYLAIENIVNKQNRKDSEFDK